MLGRWTVDRRRVSVKMACLARRPDSPAAAEDALLRASVASAPGLATATHSFGAHMAPRLAPLVCRLWCVTVSLTGRMRPLPCPGIGPPPTQPPGDQRSVAAAGGRPSLDWARLARLA